jgi:DNA-binding NtrC family response regulator
MLIASAVNPASRHFCPSRLLVVEDDPDLRPVLERAARLVDPELRVDWAVSVPEAIQQLNLGEYELVLTDYLLDERGSGFTLRSWCDYHRPRLRVAMMSAYPIGDAGSRPEIGRFLRKPFTMQQLWAFLRAALAA